MNNIVAACTDDPLITKRTFNSITTLFTGASEDLAEYISVNKPSTDLTQNKPSFTNLEASGDYRAVGIFTSRSRNRFTSVHRFYFTCQPARN